jgi:cob(I)alamin adenosyltransferase
VRQVLSGLQQPSVERLSKTWKELSSDAAKTYRHLAESMSLDAKHADKFRARIEQVSERERVHCVVLNCHTGCSAVHTLHRSVRRRATESGR